MSEDASIYKLIEITNDRLTDLQKSYLVLNDNHHHLRREFTEVKTRLETVAQIIKFFISPSLAFLLIVELCKMGGII